MFTEEVPALLHLTALEVYRKLALEVDLPDRAEASPQSLAVSPSSPP
jgi:hypothetical protein